MNNKEKNKDQVLKGIALVALIFAMVVCVLVIASYFQINRMDPVNTEVINSLVERLNENPKDELLKHQIQELDLLARKAYFINQWQVKMGGYLILLSLAVFVIAYQLMDANNRKQVLANPDQPKDILGIQKNARIGIALVGGSLVILALLLAFFMHTQLGDKLRNSGNKSEQIAESPIDDKEEEVTPIPIANVETPEVQELVGEELSELVEEPIKVIKTSNTPKKSNIGIPSEEELKNNFTSFRGYYSNGIVYQKNIPTDWDAASNKNILWKAEVPLHGFNSPIIWENKVFVSGATEAVREVFCFDGTTGEMLWRTKIENIPGSPSVAPKTTADTGLAAATMTTDGKRVYVIFGTGDIAAFDMNGKMVWGINLGVPQNHYGHSSSLIMYKDKLIVQYDQKKNSQIMALEASSGKKVWSTPREVKISWASPILVEYNGETHIITVADPFVASYNPQTGQENWKLDCIFGEVGPSAAYVDGKIFALNEYATLAAIDMDKPSEVLWEDDMILSDIPSPVATNGLLIVSTSYGLVACYDAVTGKMYWEHEFGNNIYASPMAVGDNVYLMDIKGVMHIFKASKEYSEVAQSSLGEDVVTTPAFADGRIYIRTDKNLYCIGK
jgi:outer membrane protein assembly factor BamB